MPYKPTGKPPGRPKKVKAAVAVDAANVDPRAVLAEIAADKDAPAGARVQAAKALMGRPGQPPAQPDDEPPMDDVTRRALAIMQRSGRPN